MDKLKPCRVSLTSLDLEMLLWGLETVTWADNENQADFERAVKKLERAHRNTRKAEHD